jgi:hypothetical protein
MDKRSSLEDKANAAGSDIPQSFIVEILARKC